MYAPTVEALCTGCLFDTGRECSLCHIDSLLELTESRLKLLEFKSGGENMEVSRMKH